MFLRQRRSKGSFCFFKGRNAGAVKLAILLSLAAFILFLMLIAGVQKSTAADCDCNFCHVDMHGPGWQGCATCHGNPPATGSHVKHFGITSNYQKYGDTSITRDFASLSTSYGMSCGNCHPLDNTKHRNGTVEVELYNVNAPAGSLKEKNPAIASYTPGGTVYYDNKGLPYTLGTCSNIYCHSYNAWTTPGGVPTPWPQNQNDPPVPPNTVTTRYYQNPTWGAGSLTCSGCHGNPPRTDYYTNAGGSGNSHSWLDDYGYEDGHNANMLGYNPPLDCKTCHNDTVRDAGTWAYQNWNEWFGVAFFDDSPLYNYSSHVNGAVDIAFDRVNTYQYIKMYGGYDYLTLVNAQYDPSTKSCSNVSCHQTQTPVTWGMPYRWWDSTECNRCHQM